MYYVYVIKSLRNGKRYVGYTANDVEKRLGEHNRGCNKWSRENKPFKLLTTENYSSKQEAMKREKFLKSGKGREYLDKILKNNL